jgi:6,7-dimethyl-8-ribityllumazine synthase
MILIKKLKVCIVVSIYNKEITYKSLNLAKLFLKKYKITKIDIVKAPGAFEIPVIISRLIKRYDAFVAIGCVIKGETNNFDLISKAITNGIMNLSINHNKPIGNALITVFNKSQALKRTIKGQTAAKAVVEVLLNEPKKT